MNTISYNRLNIRLHKIGIDTWTERVDDRLYIYKINSVNILPKIYIGYIDEHSLRLKIRDDYNEIFKGIRKFLKVDEYITIVD